jgi:RHS repeat-associated protein
VFIEIKPPNLPPVITSTPPTSLHQRFNPNPPGGLFTNYYQVTAFDPDVGDTLTYSLRTPPAWVTMDANGRIRFEPTCGSFGNPCNWGWTWVTVVVTDSQGATAEQTFAVNLTVFAANVPNVVGLLLPAAESAMTTAGLTSSVQNEVFDLAPAGTVLAQDPIAGAPNVGAGGAVNLTVSKGPQPVLMPFLIGQQLAVANTLLVGMGLSSTVTSVTSATIPAGEVTAQNPAFGTLLVPSTAPPVSLTVSAGGPLAAPIARIDLEPGPATRLAGETIPYRAVATLTNGTSADVSLTAAWSSTTTGVATIDTAGKARAIAAGTTTISASQNSVVGSALLTVAAQALGDNMPPTAAITSPADGASVTGPVPIVGTASDANFLRYELAIALATEETFTVLAEGTTAVTNGTLGTLDPTTLLNELYTVRLRVFDRAENESVVTRSIQVSGDRKVGLFTLTYQDLKVPAAGIPVVVDRTYDSRDKARGDFGVGWRLGFNTLRLRTNRVLGTGWVRVVSGPMVTLTPTSEHRVSVTLADGRVEMFDMQVSPTSNLGSLGFTNVVGFPARPGTLGRLEALANSSLLIVSGGQEDELVDDSTLNTYDPQLYRYTASDGTQFEISPRDGVRKVTDANGNTVTFGPAGILHSSGKNVLFTRDPQGRIVSITDPAGNVQSYGYDGNGDLVTHTSATGGVSRYAYDRHHGLIEIRDATGAGAIRNEYDASGRLVAVIDANGNRVAFSHNDAAQEDVVTDRRGNVSKLRYDAVGNIVGREQLVTIEGTAVNALTTMTYDAQGNETSLVDPDGKRTSSTYSGVLVTGTVVDPGGLDLSNAYSYNARNDPASASDSGGRSYTFGYDAAGNLTSFAAPDIGAGTAVVDARGLPTQTRDALGTTTHLTRDAAGNITREEVRDALSALLRRIDYAYDANGNKTAETLQRTIAGVPTPLTTRFGYDADNRLVSVTDPLGGVSRTEYDAAGRVVAQVDPLGRRTSFSYDALGRRTRTTFADGTSQTLAYDANGNVIGETDQAGRTTSYSYDELDRNVATTLPGGATTRTVYSAGGRVTATIDANGNRTDYTYDAAGRNIATTLPAVDNGTGGATIRPRIARTLNALGAPTSVVDANGRTTTFAYDPAGRLVQTTFADGSSVRQTWDALGRRTSIVNEEGQATHFAYDGLGRLVSVSGLAGDATYTYDEAGNLLTQTDALGRVTRLRYDASNRLVERQHPGGETERFAYDAVGNVVAYTRPDGTTITLTYDAMNRVVRKSLPGGAAIVTTYNADGSRATVTDARGVTTYGYDTAGRIASITHPGGEVVTTARDANGNLATLASPAATIGYGYDALNRLIRVTAPEGQSRAFYDPAGNRVRTTHANGMATDATFDARNRLTQLAHKTPAGTAMQSFTNVYSLAGRRTQVTELDGSVATFAYDARGRLASESRSGSSPVTITHGYDAVGNRTQIVRTGVPSTLTYDVNDRLTSDGSTTYSYDINGNLTARNAGGVTTQYGYDAENRLVTISGSGTATQYAYDADGQRVLVNESGTVTKLVNDAANPTGLSQVLEERDGSGAVRARYSYGNELLSMARGGISSFHLRDSIGSVRGLADTASALTDRYHYDGYGNTLSSVGTTANPYRFAGERADSDGLYALRARYYDPIAGRFITRDPFAGRIQRPVSLHRYLYANADPVNFVDPTGEETLLNLTFTQGILSTTEKAMLATQTTQLCAAKSTVDQVQSLVATSQQVIALGGLLATGVLAFASASGGKGGSVDFSYVSPDFAKESIIKNFQLQLKGSGGRLGLGLVLSGHKNQALKATAYLLPPPMSVSFSGAAKTAFEKKFYYCGLVEIGKFSLESEVQGNVGADGGKGLYGGVSWSNTVEASLFRGTLNVSWPVFSVSTKNYTTTFSLLGLYERSYTAIGATPY